MQTRDAIIAGLQFIKFWTPDAVDVYIDAILNNPALVDLLASIINGWLPHASIQARFGTHAMSPADIAAFQAAGVDIAAVVQLIQTLLKFIHLA